MRNALSDRLWYQRPGPYINAEVTGGGFPGWLQRVQGALRTGDEAYLEATEKYNTPQQYPVPPY